MNLIPKLLGGERDERSRPSAVNFLIARAVRNIGVFVAAIWRDWAPLLSPRMCQEYAKSQSWWQEFVNGESARVSFIGSSSSPNCSLATVGALDVVIGNLMDKNYSRPQRFYGQRTCLNCDSRCYGGELEATSLRERIGRPKSSRSLKAKKNQKKLR